VVECDHQVLNIEGGATAAAVAVGEVAQALGLRGKEVTYNAFGRLLNERTRRILQTRLEILPSYNAAAVEDLEAETASGGAPEHPAWEDLTLIENLTGCLAEPDGYLRRLGGTG